MMSSDDGSLGAGLGAEDGRGGIGDLGAGLGDDRGLVEGVGDTAAMMSRIVIAVRVVTSLPGGGAAAGGADQEEAFLD